MAQKTFTLIVVPDHSQQVRRFRVQLRLLWQLAGAGILVALFLLGAGVHYVAVARDAAENDVLRKQNVLLRTELSAVRERIEHIGTTLDRVERFDQKLRAITLLSDPQRNLAMGPVGEPQDQTTPSADSPAAELAPGALASRLDRLTSEATRQEQSLQQLQAYFQDQKSLLASTPSTWPVRGWVTSDFGQRLDPYTADRVMHSGLDIAGPHGKEIIAPADGTVVFSGLEGGYGNVIVIDHGYGIKTRYGHLSSLQAKAGEKVNRGQVIATLGNTGRSTGPHLHYEVRVDGLPQNPRKFILDEDQ